MPESAAQDTIRTPSRSTWRTIGASGFGIAAVGLVLSACSVDQLGLPRVALEVPSPDGRSIAYVRNHMELDPPNQSLWLRLADGKRKKLLHLGPDSDWCNTIVWSADGSMVAFLVQDARVVVADALRGEVVREEWLVPEPRHYPTRERVTEIEFVQGGSELEYRLCPRHCTGDCSERKAALIPVSR